MLNEGLEVLGTDEYFESSEMYFGVFEESAVERVSLPSSLKRIEYGAFRSCANLAKITLPQGLENIGSGAFFSCKRLKDI